MFCQFFPFLFDYRISLRNPWAEPSYDSIRPLKTKSASSVRATLQQGRNSPERTTSTSKASDQVVLDGVAGSSGSRGDLDFAIDRGQVVVDSARADHEAFGDLGIGQSLCQQAQDFDFTGG